MSASLSALEIGPSFDDVPFDLVHELAASLGKIGQLLA